MSATEKTACEVAWETAMEKTLEVCDSEEAAMSEAARLFGIEPPDGDCGEILGAGPGGQNREWVLCRVFTGDDPLMDDHGDVRDAFEAAWDEIDAEPEVEEVDA